MKNKRERVLLPLDRRKVKISSTLDPQLYEQLREKRIKISYALTVGARYLLGMETVLEYDQPRIEELEAKIKRMAYMLEEQARVIERNEAARRRRESKNNKGGVAE